jgi:hypothetical protein
MLGLKPDVNITIQYPEPELTPEQKLDLENRMKSAVVLLFPDLTIKWNPVVRSEPRVSKT